MNNNAALSVMYPPQANAMLIGSKPKHYDSKQSHRDSYGRPPYCALCRAGHD